MSVFDKYLKQKSEQDLAQIEEKSVNEPVEADIAQEPAQFDIKVNPKGGMKHEAGKVAADLYQPGMSLPSQLALHYGCYKYGPNNYQQLEPYVIRGALKRHFDAYMAGEWLDDESGNDHLAGLCWAAEVLHCMRYDTFSKVEDQRKEKISSWSRLEPLRQILKLASQTSSKKIQLILDLIEEKKLQGWE